VGQWTNNNISGLLSLASLLSLEQEPHLAQVTLQLPEPRFGTVCLLTCDFTHSRYGHD